MSTSKVNIRPNASMLAVLASVNYTEWYALAEFVDNSLQSYLRSNLAEPDAAGVRCPVTVKIEPDPAAKSMTIRDDAAGIPLDDFERAFRAAAPPSDRSGLSEFGMGMKAAACWFARRWTVRTSVAGEAIERRISFDMARIVATEEEELAIEEVPAPEDAHYTVVVLEDMIRFPLTSTVTKIKSHLSGIYRRFIAEGTLVLRYKGDDLAYQEPAALVAPPWGRGGALSQEVVTWYKPLSIEFGSGLVATGFAGIRERASTAEAGLALFRRGRVIVGSGDATYRPKAIFGNPNDFAYQRIWGELDIEALGVAYTKDGFVWSDLEDEFLTKLRAALDDGDLPLIRQANNYRSKPTRERSTQERADEAAANTAEAVESQGVREELERQTSEIEIEPEAPATTQAMTRREATVEVDGTTWIVGIEVDEDPSRTEFLSTMDASVGATTPNGRRIEFRLGLAHPFVRRYVGANMENLEMLCLLAAAISLGEATASSGDRRDQACRMRRNVGRVLERLATAQI